MRTREEMDREIERVARRMCEEVGLNPDESVHCDEADTYPFYEISPVGTRTYQPPLVGAPAYVVALYRPYVARWRSLRRQASLAIAGWRAVHGYVMTEM